MRQNMIYENWKIVPPQRFKSYIFQLVLQHYSDKAVSLNNVGFIPLPTCLWLTVIVLQSIANWQMPS